MSLRETLSALRAAWPILRRAAAAGLLWRPACELLPADPDVDCAYDVRIPQSDGSFVTANVFRSKAALAAGRRLPVIMSAHPYDASLLPALGRTPFGGPPQQYRTIPQARRPRFSTLTSWEAPDPNYWCAAGYAVVNMNMPGYASSGGRPSLFSQDQARAYWEAIEWVAAQDWSNGRVGLAGVSYLAISQYLVATCEHYGGAPPALRAISPWEGVADFYREFFCWGGVGEVGFPDFWWVTEVKPTLAGSPEDLLATEGTLPPRLLIDHPDYDEFWRKRSAALERIDVPMLVCGSFADHGLHTEGSFRAFVEAASERKWLYTHRDLKWDAFYGDDALATMRAFFDCFLKEDGDRTFLDRAPVRLEVRSDRDTIHAVRDETDWPLPDTNYRRLALDARAHELCDGPVDEPATVTWRATDAVGATFGYRFAQDREWSGYAKLRLWVEVGDDAGDDLILFVALFKLDRAGRRVPFSGAVGNKHDAVTRGQIAASWRRLDETRSTEWHPRLAHSGRQPLEPRQPVALEIALLPSATWFAAGEGLELVLAPNEIVSSPPFRKDVSPNRGTHRLRAGGAFDAHLLVPEILAR